MEIIKIEAETYIHTCPEEFGITFLGIGLNIVKALEGAAVAYNEQGEQVLEWSEMVRTWLKTEKNVNKLVKELQDYYINEEDWSDYETLEDFFFEDSEYFIREIICDEEKAVEFFEANGLQLGTVGYSPWSYYIAPMDVSTSFIRDLWEGWNFYSMSLLDENGEVKDSICEVYIPNTAELEEVVQAYYDIKDFYLVDNEESEYMDVKKVREIQKVELAYKII